MTTLPGINQLLTTSHTLLRNQRVGLVSNASGVTNTHISTVDALRVLPDVQMTSLFAPEHGFQTAIAAGEQVASVQDKKTGLPVFSLYGETQKPTVDMLADIDVLIFDIQTAGVRFFTYIATLLYIMEAAAKHNIRILICDRPNPIGGQRVEGPVLDTAFTSFVGPGPLPIRTGLTIGELGLYYQKAWVIDCDLTVIPCQG